MDPRRIFDQLVSTDAGAPRITFYDNSRGERIELSARVLANWIAKAANALGQEWQLEPGSALRLSLPGHWRALYWAWGAWSLGAAVAIERAPDRSENRGGGGVEPQVLAVVSDDLHRLEAGDIFTVLPSLARSIPGTLPGDIWDETSELASCGDQFVPEAPFAEQDPIIVMGESDAASAVITASQLRPAQLPDGVRLHLHSPDAANLLAAALAAWQVGGSLVVSHGPSGSEAERTRRLESERVTLDAHQRRFSFVDDGPPSAPDTQPPR